MNLASYQVSVSGQQIELTYKEYELLRFLLTHRGRVFSRDALLRHVWGESIWAAHAPWTSTSVACALKSAPSSMS
jgi:DNA-binding response OmpR family regulator